jgi:lipopolysaccharide assembly outer membrane protein LptD (OstA)
LRTALRVWVLIFVSLATQVASAADSAAPALVRPPGEEPAEVLADSIEYDRARQLYTAHGNVRLSQGRRTLTADWVTFNNTTRQGVASGDVVVIDGPDTLRAHFMEFNVDTLEGVVFDGHMDGRTTPFKMSGAEIQRTGKESYTFEKAVFTTCKCPDPEDRDPWQITATHADLDVEGYGRARNTTFDVLGVPVLYFPYLIYPLKRERETGFLFPLFSQTSRSGLELGLPFFWAARENLNLMLTPQWLEYRGFKPNIDAEWVFGKENTSRLHGSFIYDTDIKNGDPDTTFDSHRWAVRWFHDQWLPDGTRLQMDVNQVSDNSYPFDFDDMTQFRSDRFMISQSIATKTFGASGRFGLVGSTVIRNDLQNPDSIDRDKLAMQRLPDLAFNALPAELVPDTGILGSFDAQYTFFEAFKNAYSVNGPERNVDDVYFDTGRDGVPDKLERLPDGTVPGVGFDPNRDNFPLGPEGDGVFQEGEILANRGHRLLLRPRLSRPLRLFDFLEILPEAGYREGLYASDALGFEQRAYVTGRVDLRTRLRRTMELPFGIGSATHLLEPRIGWALLAKSTVSKNPIFIPQTAFPQQRIRELTLDNVTLDPADRLVSEDAVTAGFGNRVYGKGTDGSAPRLLADFTVLGQYDFAQDRAGELVLDGTAYPGGGIYTRLIFGYQMQEQRFDEALVQASWSSKEGNDLGIFYRFLDQIPPFFQFSDYNVYREGLDTTTFAQVNQMGVSARWALTRSWALTYSGTYSATNSVFLGNLGGVEYLSKCKCWAVRVEASEDPVRGARFNFQYRITGLGDDTVRPFAGYRGGRLRSTGSGGF